MFSKQVAAQPLANPNIRVIRAIRGILLSSAELSEILFTPSSIQPFNASTCHEVTEPA